MPDEEFVGRMLLASLHQAVGEVLPARLGFYEHWLTPDAAPGVTSFMAMLSFLQQEGEAFDLISSRAGHYAAVRIFQDLSSLRRASLHMLPRGMRARKAVSLLTRLLPSLYPETRIDTTRRRTTIFVGIEGSPFCAVRGSREPATCSFYSSAIATFLQLLNLHPSVRVRGCQSMGMRSCLLMVLPDQAPSTVTERAVLGLDADVMIPPSLELAGPGEMTPAIEAQVPIYEAVRASEAVDASETAAVSERVPGTDVALVPETIPTHEAAPGVEVAPSAEAAISDAAPDAFAASAADSPPSLDVSSTSAAESAVAAAPDVAALWDAVLAKRTRPPGSIRLKLDTLFARPTSGVDAEEVWHRLD